MSTFSVATLERGHTEHDAEALAGLYADDAIITIIDATSPPSAPTILHGQDQILAYYQDICGRPMTHHVHDAFGDDEHLAFHVACEYDSGERVMTSEICTLRDGKITAETLVQAWDS